MSKLIILYYTLMSSMMLIVNKVTIYMLPFPFFILSCQTLLAAAIMISFRICGNLHIDKLPRQFRPHFALLVMGFVGTIYCNIKTLQYSNVETFITFRSSTPLVISIIDYSFLGRQFVSKRSLASLLMMICGSAGYVYFDSGFHVMAYTWLMGWYMFYTFDVVFIKHVCDVVQMSDWSRVYYTNILASIPFTVMFLQCSNEMTSIKYFPISHSLIFMLLMSCVWGIGMSHATYVLRDAVSATSFTVVGIMCKVFSVIVNLIIWENHATPSGLICLCVCLIAGSMYQQAPKKPVSQ